MLMPSYTPVAAQAPPNTGRPVLAAGKFLT
jgi:hypothetical protein